MRKEICIDVRMATSSGIGTYIRNLVQGLQEGPYRLRLLANEETVRAWPKLHQFDLILTKAHVYSLKEQWMLPFAIPPCDIFFSPHYPVPLLPIRAKRRVVTIHDVCHLAFAHDLALHKRWYARSMLKRAAHLVDKVITVSNFSKTEIVRYLRVDPRKVSTIHLGVDRELFSEQGNIAVQQSVRDKYNLVQHYFIFVSTLAPHKNVQRLLQAWDLVVQKFPEWQLVCVGRQVRRSVPVCGRGVVLLEGVLDGELPALYQLASAMVHPALYEGFGLTPLEAMSCGCPAVVSKAASLPEVYGESVHYFDPYDVRSIASGMEMMIQDAAVRAELRVKGFARSGELTWQKMVEAHVKVFDAEIRTPTSSSYLPI